MMFLASNCFAWALDPFVVCSWVFLFACLPSAGHSPAVKETDTSILGSQIRIQKF